MSDAEVQAARPLVSIVLPVYNVAPYLRQCLDTVVDQTYDHLEIIAVDDGSTDGSLAILEEYAARDERIAVLAQANGGGGAARNHGMEHATGDYITFLDSDDYFAPELIEHCLAKALATDADIVIHNGAPLDSIKNEINTKHSYIDRSIMRRYGSPEVFSWRDMPDEITEAVRPAPWLRLYKRQFVANQHLRFQEISNSNDYLMGHLSLCCAERIAMVDEQLVIYRYNNSASTQGRKSKHADCVLMAIQALHDELEERGLLPDVEKSFVSTALGTMAFSLRTLNVDGRETFLEALENRFSGLHYVFEGDASWYVREKFYKHACLVRSALEQYRYWKRIAQRGPDPVPLEGDDKPLVSVVMPVYNSSEYLDEAVGSILAQTMGDLELICVDDGSTDDSLSKLQAWAAKDSRVHVRTKCNQGPSLARNLAMDLARGTYLLMADSDDMFRHDALELLIERMTAHELDVLLFTADVMMEDDTERARIYDNYYVRRGTYDGVHSGIDLMAAQCAEKDYRVAVYLQFVRREMIERHGLRFIPGILHEDNPYTFQLLLRAKRVEYINEALYYRRVHPGSIMTQPKTFAHAFGYYMAYRAMSSELFRVADSLDQSTYELLSRIVNKMVYSSQRMYLEIPDEQVGSHHGVGRYRNEFYHHVIRVCAAEKSIERKDEQLESVKQRLSEVTQENEDLATQVHSRAHRIGVALATPARVVVDTVRHLRRKA